MDPSCSICAGSSEIVLHILRECPQPKEACLGIQFLVLLFGIFGSGEIIVFLIVRRLYLIAPKILYLEAAKEWLLHVYVSQPQKLNVLVSLVWVPLDVRWFKLNVDGSRRFSCGTIGTGGVLRNCNEDWVEGFTANLGQG
ncbi:uncharacterized protein LOC117616005 [Prunus dulcis]|uniref:uncharacterized protein LOC117616005 n=1 Tax=Prunus dulcis TaxID=3755 RepID=UPI001483828C|nr:uncharacterized protein LOC117616005 [Prunus dulcis]